MWRWVIEPSRTMIAPMPSYHDSSRPRIGSTAWAATTARTSSVSSNPRAASQRRSRSNQSASSPRRFRSSPPSSLHAADRTSRICCHPSGSPARRRRNGTASIQSPASVDPTRSGRPTPGKPDRNRPDRRMDRRPPRTRTVAPPPGCRSDLCYTWRPMADQPPRRATNYRRGGLAALALALLAIVVTAVRDDDAGDDGGSTSTTATTAAPAP